MNSNGLKNKTWPQYVAATSACLGMASAGTVVGWTSPSMIKLLSDESPISMTYNDMSWIASITAVGSALAAIFTAYAIDRIGRKPVILISSICYIVCWISAILATNIMLLYVSRFLAGFASGTSMTCTPIYIGETAEQSRRGSLGVLKTLSLSFGIVFESVIGPRVSFRMLNGLSMIFPVLLLLTFVGMPESPHYLVAKKHIDQANSALMWLRGHKELKSIEKEMEDIKIFSGSNDNMNFLETLRAICSTRNRKALVLISIVLFGTQFSGLIAIASFTQSIFVTIDSPINPPDAVIILNSVTFVFILITMFIIDKVGRKILLLVSMLGCSLSHVVIATYLMLSTNGIIGIDYSWVAMVALFSFKMFLSFGITSIPFILMSEIFPTEIKAWSNCLAALYQALFALIITKLFQILDESIGAYIAFFIFAASLFVSSIFIVIFMPETKNKSFNEIQELLQNKQKIATDKTSL